MPGVNVDDEDLCSYLMYEQVYLDYMGRRRESGPVRTLPTPTFFYGMEPGEDYENFKASWSSALQAFQDRQVDVYINGGDLGKVFKVHGLHFHWGEDNTKGSEHRVNGKMYPLEVKAMFRFL